MIRLLRTCFIAALILPLPLQATTHSQALPSSVEKALTKSKIPTSSMSLVALPLDGEGQGIVFNADRAVNPASTMKLVTTYAALELLGPAHQWRTEFYGDGPVKDGVLNGNLYVKGGGDPKLNMERLWLMMRDLRINGIQRVTGDLILDRSHFNLPQLPAFNDDGQDQTKPFLVGPDSLLVNLKTVRMVVRTDGARANVQMDPPLPNVQITNRVELLPAAKCPDWPDIRYHPSTQDGHTTLVVSGKLPPNCSAQNYVALLDHADYAANAMRGIWHELGGQIDGGDRLGEVPESAKLLARTFSPDLTEVARDINKFSNNTMAQQLLLSIGHSYRLGSDQDDAQAASRTIKNWLSKKGIQAPNLVIENGSGLSRNERISARELAGMLQAAWQSPYAAEFIASMPLVGMDGTMRRRLARSGMQGKAHIKTGTLNNVRAIAGFTKTAKGKDWVVVAIINDPRPWGASSILDQALLEIYRR